MASGRLGQGRGAALAERVTVLGVEIARQLKEQAFMLAAHADQFEFDHAATPPPLWRMWDKGDRRQAGRGPGQAAVSRVAAFKFSQLRPAARMQALPSGEVLTIVQLPLLTELNTCSRLPLA